VYERDACNPVQQDIEDKEKGDENRRHICAEDTHPLHGRNRRLDI